MKATSSILISGECVPCCEVYSAYLCVFSVCVCFLCVVFCVLFVRVFFCVDIYPAFLYCSFASEINHIEPAVCHIDTN